MDNAAQSKVPEYPGTYQIVPGVFIAVGDAIYIADDQGEIATWNFDEVSEDGDAFTAAVTAAIMAAVHGPASVRENIARGGAILDKMLGERRYCKSCHGRGFFVLRDGNERLLQSLPVGYVAITVCTRCGRFSDSDEAAQASGAPDPRRLYKQDGRYNVIVVNDGRFD